MPHTSEPRPEQGEAIPAPPRQLGLLVPLAYVGVYWLWLAYLGLVRGEAVLATRADWTRTGHTSIWLVIIGLWGAPLSRWLWRRILAP